MLDPTRRRNLEISAEHYERLRRWCAVRHIEVAELIEARVRHVLGDPIVGFAPAVRRAVLDAATAGWS